MPLPLPLSRLNGKKCSRPASTIFCASLPRPGIFDCMARHLGVRYIYADAAHPVASDGAVTLRAEDVATLPQDLRDELENAIVSLDPQRIAVVVDRVSDRNALLGRVLGRLTADLTYSRFSTPSRDPRRS